MKNIKEFVEELLECLIDEVKNSVIPSERAIFVLSKYKDDYKIVRDYFKEIDC